MKHFTSYYANYKNIPKDYMCIGISRTCPDWFKNNQEELGNFFWVKDNILAPTNELLSAIKEGKIDVEEYKKQYIKGIFDWIENDKCFKDIPDYIRQMDEHFSSCLTSWKAIVFMCYEAPHEFCHRHLWRRLLTKVYNINCEEFGVKEINTWGYKNDSNIPQDSSTISLFE